MEPTSSNLRGFFVPVSEARSISLMSIERDPNIAFDPQGTLRATTRWVSQHDEGLPEWLKNVRRAYQVDRANVKDEHRVAMVLLQDSASGKPARIVRLWLGYFSSNSVLSRE